MNLRYFFCLNFSRYLAIVILAMFISQTSFSQQTVAGGEKEIRLNQTGFYPYGPKTAIVLAGTGNVFFIENSKKKPVFTGELHHSVKPDFAGNRTWVADFSSFTRPGTYLLHVPGVGYSYPFQIKNDVFKAVANGTIKAYYYMRASVPLKEKYAGKWAREEGHPDTAVLVHSSAASEKRPEGTIISAPRGWYDAGDYNKYIVNSGISTSTLLSLYEDFPVYMKTVKLNIPESGNHIPDVLNEVLWNLRLDAQHAGPK